MGKIQINTQSIKNELKSFGKKPAESMLEYVWNGFDAGADNVNISLSFPDTIDGISFGMPTLIISDDGSGWDFEKLTSANLFLVSSKKYRKYLSLPHGRRGVGRFTFYSFAKNATWETVVSDKKFKLTLESESLDRYDFEDVIDDSISIFKGTKVIFNVTSEKITEAFLQNELTPILLEEFCWFLELYPNKNIFINGKMLDIKSIVKKRVSDKFNIEGFDFLLELIQWQKKPLGEYSKFYFKDAKGSEKFKTTTGLNYKSDIFYHSAFVQSDFFNEFNAPINLRDEESNSLPLESTEQKKNKKIYVQLRSRIVKKLLELRKPYLNEVSVEKVREWKEKNILPIVTEFGLSQEYYEDMVREIYVAVPQLFTDTGENQKKVILRFFASMLNSEDRDYILKILEQVYELSLDDKKILVDLLERTTLSNVLKTIKEIDHRLHIINSLEEILFNPENVKFTKEVSHLQKILDENFWMFGEGYRLFSSTEGSIRKTLVKFKDEILRKDEEEISTRSRKELDIFLTKTETTSKETTCIVVEIKRPSVVLGKKQLDQIKGYMETIIREPSCNGGKIIWEFYLIGNEFDENMQEEIESHESWGEKRNGLVHRVKNGNVKLYVQKWSDIINVEQKSKYEYLKEKLNIELRKIDNKNIDNIVNDVIDVKNN